MSEWHVPPALLRAWVDDRASAAAADSVEAHLMSCDGCRRAVAVGGGVAAASSTGVDLGAVWTGVREQVEPQRPTGVARLLAWCGVPDSEAALLAATPSLSMPWIGALVLVLAFAVGAAFWGIDGQAGLFLLVAPLAPMAGVAAAYGAEVDPCHELALTTPWSQVRLLLLRTAAVLGVCLPLTAVASLGVHGSGWPASAWLVPSGAFVVLTLAAATWVEPSHAAAAIAVVWTLVMLPTIVGREPVRAQEPTVLAMELLLAAAAAAVLVVRSARLGTDRRSR